jgi:hypothetical protein
MWKRTVARWEWATLAVLLTGACADARPTEPEVANTGTPATYSGAALDGAALVSGDPPPMHETQGEIQPLYAPVACGTAISGYVNDPRAHYLNVTGTRVTARGNLGFSTFTMSNGYQLSSHRIGTPGAANQRLFIANKGAAHFAGPFHEVFPDRGNTNVDRWEFWAANSGVVWLRSLTWSPHAWVMLQGTTCSRGPQRQTVVRGYIDNTSSGFGTDYWTFLLQPDELI